MHGSSIARLACVLLCGAPLTLHAQSLRITGEVNDSVHRAPLADATVLATPVAPTRDTVFHSARTDAAGRFEIGRLQAGRYEISVEHAFTDSIGLSVPPREVEVPAQSAAPLVLALPSVRTLRRTLCRAAEADTTLGVMLGTVRRTDGSTVKGAGVVFEWMDVSVDRATLQAKQTRMTASTRTDSVGVYRACGLPAGIALFVQAQLGANEQSGVVEEHIGEAGVLVRELVVGDSTRTRQVAVGTGTTADADTGAVHGDGVIRGVVRNERGPLANARVHLFGTSRSATTNAAGEFRLADIPTGTQGLEIIALGYAPRRLRAEVSATTEPMTVTMSRIASVLDSIRVTARRIANGRRYNEFDERSRNGHGRYITEQEVERRHPFVTSDLLRVMPGVTVSVGRDNEHIVSMRRCQPAVYLDGMESALPLDEIPTSWIHGVEVYQISEIPSQYRGRGLCGVILVWTK
jgi:hypothetical protein